MTTRKNPHLVRETKSPELQQLAEQLEHDPRQLELLTAPCNCQATDARVCFMIRYGEDPNANLRCSCSCHARGGR